MTDHSSTSAVRPLGDAEAAAVATVGCAVAALGLVGLVNSFAAVTAALRPAFGPLAWTATLGIDLGIAVFSALGLVLARLDMHLAWLRVVPWTLVAATIYLNVAPQRTWVGRTAHAALPALWVIAVDVAIHAIRVRAGLAAGRRMDAIRRSRWLLAPIPTLLLWRRMVLWEIRSYPDALARERRRLLALTELKDRYGRVRLGRVSLRVPWAWRWRAPRLDRALYRLGELTPASAIDATPADTTTEGRPAPVRTPRRAARRRTPAGTTADAVAQLRAEDATLTAGDIATRLGVSDRTVRRHLAAHRATPSFTFSEGNAPA